MRHFAIAAIRELLARCVDPYLGCITVPVQMNNDAIPERSRIRAAAVDRADPIHDGVLEPEVGEHRVVDAWMPDGRRDAEVAVTWDDLLPGNLSCATFQLIGVVARKGVKQVQHSHGDSGEQIEPNGFEHVSVKFDAGAVTHNDRSAKSVHFGGKHVVLAVGAGQSKCRCLCEVHEKRRGARWCW